ncbi:MAG: HAD hydrolase-like protein [Marinosulfonomonas sp.]|nr:HAD hydrolase-like protein [Marinosulfonomonas sp.]
MRTVIFDLDGTLADTSQDLINAANMCFQGLGLGDLLNVETDQKVAMMGGGRAMLQLGFERAGVTHVPEKIEQNYEVFLNAYGENIDVHTRLYPGADSAIEALGNAGYAVGVCTNKPESFAQDLLMRLGVRSLFASLVGADTLSVRKPDARPMHEAVRRAGGDVKKSILVGDSPTDRDTARAAGVKSLLVTFGPDGGNVAQLSPDALLDDYRDLGGVVARLIG